MNHIYRLVWNAQNQCWQAVSEIAKATGKPQSSTAAARLPRLRKLVLGLASAWLAASPMAWAGPQGGTVTAGSASIQVQGSTTTIQQASAKVAIDWTAFSIGKNETVQFKQPDANAIALNRVTGTESSQILGSLQANGQVFVLNPNGMLVGQGAQINAGGFVASTLGMSNADFMNGRYRLTDAGAAANASIVNQGNIAVTPGANIVLIAPIVQNTGTLSAAQGTVLMASAGAVTLMLPGQGKLGYTLDQGALQSLVDNGGLIQAAGGHVVLTAKGRDALVKATANHQPTQRCGRTAGRHAKRTTPFERSHRCQRPSWR
jgi:filamentous hemagglutinin family protein